MTDLHAKISVIICTHNPRADYLRRVLDALKMQTLPKEQWELLLIDNASKVALANSWDLSWHPHARHVREEELGLTPTRLRGIKEFTGELLVFVDDDNVLGKDYLERALELSETWPTLGCWGGCILPEYEVSPEPWFSRYADLLALKDLKQDFWSNDPDSLNAVPFGAGICVRRAVAMAYAANVHKHPISIMLGRRGKNLMSAEDIDLVWTSPLLGLGFGVFCKMRLIHLIPKGRLEYNYILALIEKSAASILLVKYKRTGIAPVIQPKLHFFIRSTLKRLTQTSLDWHHFRAYSSGERLAFNIINTLKTSQAVTATVGEHGKSK
jgi:glycosyltransferase involved in cell wall biosynthesis